MGKYSSRKPKMILQEKRKLQRGLLDLFFGRSHHETKPVRFLSLSHMRRALICL